MRFGYRPDGKKSVGGTCRARDNTSRLADDELNIIATDYGTINTVAFGDLLLGRLSLGLVDATDFEKLALMFLIDMVKDNTSDFNMICHISMLPK